MLSIGNRYKHHKDNVIDLFKAYKKKRGSINDGVNIEFLETRINSLKEGKYILAVAGEVKAGKSTFINALIGSEILPSDALQATSAIIEIFKSEKSFLKVKYASGRDEEVYDDITTPDIEEAQEKLKILCSLQKEYLDINHVSGILNELILLGKKLEVDENLISLLEEKSPDSIKYTKPLSECKDLISKYINEHNPDNIPAKIQFGYPLKWDFDELRIVDTPGVHALGGVQETSYKYFEKADALVFVKNIYPVEGLPFRNFVDSVISNRARETLFLVLTNTSTRFNETERLLKETKRTYEMEIPNERILAVDSISKLIHKDIENGKVIKDIRKESDSKKIVIDLFKGEAEDKGKELSKEIFLEWSGFEKMFETINEFSLQAPNLQLNEILKSIRDGYEEQDKLYDDKLNILGVKKKNPQEFENEIYRLNKALENYKLLSHKTIEELNQNYSGKHSDWQTKIDEHKNKYPKLVNEANDIQKIRKYCKDAENEVLDLTNEVSFTLTDFLRDKLKLINKEFQNEHNITVPKVDLTALEEVTKKNANVTTDIKENRPVDFWDVITIGIARIFRDNEIIVGTKSEYNKDKHLDLIKSAYNKEFYNIANGLVIDFKNIVKSYSELFSKEITIAISERQSELQSELENKQSNNEIIQEIDMINSKKKDLPIELRRVEELLEELK